MDGKKQEVKKDTGASWCCKTITGINLYSLDRGFCIGQEFIKEKTNKIPARPVLLGKMDLKGKIVIRHLIPRKKQ